MLDALYDLRQHGAARVGSILVSVYDIGRWGFVIYYGDRQGSRWLFKKTYATQADAIDGAMQAVRVAEDIFKGKTNEAFLRSAASRKKGHLHELFTFFADHFDEIREGT